MASSSASSSASPFIPSASSPAPIAPNVLPRQPPLAVKPATTINVVSTDIAPKPCSMMSKEWIIPPRPKPGRKPATDTPPTKRKAQNRAAQRAFRERRAARVSELEEQMRQVEEEHKREIGRLKSQIDSLSVQLQQYRNETGWWEKRCQNLEGDLQVERNAKDALVKAREEEKKHQREIAARHQHEQEKQRRQQEREQQQRQQQQQQQQQRLSSSPMQRDINSPSESQQLPQADVPIQSVMAGSTGEGQDMLEGCNNCSVDKCKCIDDAFNVPDASGTGPFGEMVEREAYSAPAVSRQTPHHEERHQHQHRAQSEQRQQQEQHKEHEPQVKSEYDEMEIDFTEQFATKRPTAVAGAPAPPPTTSAQQRTDEEMFTSAAPPSLFETCGFCQDGTPCLCAEMAAEEQQQRQQMQMRNRQIALQDLEKAEQARLAASSDRCVKSRMPTIQSLSHMTPPPSESDVFSESLPPISSLTRGGGDTISSCGENGPGTCLQCQSDPRSTLFCKSLAAARALNAAKYGANPHGTSSSTGPAPGSASSSSGGGGCCGGGGRAGGGCCKDIQRDPTAAPPLTLSCADTFTTLSRHPQFLRATDELDTWMPRLITLPNPAHLPSGGNAGSGGGSGVDIGERPAMEVEAASVMNVLRYFDRRFSY